MFQFLQGDPKISPNLYRLKTNNPVPLLECPGLFLRFTQTIELLFQPHEKVIDPYIREDNT
jgi:hypothetical protein